MITIIGEAFDALGHRWNGTTPAEASITADTYTHVLVDGPEVDYGKLVG